MELKIIPATLPEQAFEFNYEELKKELESRTEAYSSLVYTDAEIKQAKADRAALNKLKQALNNERIRREREWIEPFVPFKKKIADLINIIDKSSTNIDKQIKAYEEEQQKKKVEDIIDFFNACGFPEGISLNLVMDPKWLNASVTLKKINEELQAAAEKITSEMKVIEDLPAFQLEAKNIYLQTLDLGRAVAQSHRLTELAEQQKRREEEMTQRKKQETAEAEIKAAEVKAAPMPEEKLEESALAEWIGFEALLTMKQARDLGEYFRSHNIQYRKPRKEG